MLKIILRCFNIYEKKVFTIEKLKREGNNEKS
jgi:hypothetical protein